MIKPACQLKQLLWFFALLFGNIAQAREFIITMHESTNALGRCQEIVSTAYQNLKIPIKLVPYPGRRALMLANTGQVDADLCRIEHIGKRYSNLIKVTPHLMEVSIVAVSTNKEINIAKTNDLKQLRLVSVTGMKAAELFYKDFAIEYVNTSKKALALVKSGHADVAIVALNVLPKQSRGLKVHMPPLQQHFMHHYIHKKHVDLIPKLQLQFEKIKAQR